MRTKRVLITAELLPDFFKDRGLIRVTKPLPEDAKLLRFHYDNRIDSFVLIFESSEWEEVIPGCALRDFTLEFTRYDASILDEEEDIVLPNPKYKLESRIDDVNVATGEGVSKWTHKRLQE